MSDDIKKILEQFNRIDAEMGGKNIPVDDEATRLKGYRNIVEGRFAAITEKKRLNAQESKWNSKFGFMRSLDEGRKSMESQPFEPTEEYPERNGEWPIRMNDGTVLYPDDGEGYWDPDADAYVDHEEYRRRNGMDKMYEGKKKEKIGDESPMSEDHLEDCEPTDEFIAGSDVEECDDLEEGLAGDKLAHFRATAVNDAGLTFGFEFQYPNWNGVQEYAQKILDAKVAKDELHKKHGPWRATKIDVGYL